MPPPIGALHLEGGLVWGKGMFIGIDAIGGFGLNEGGSFSSHYGAAGGGGLNLGAVYDLPVDNLKLAYGGSAGLWMVEEGNGPGKEHKYTSNFLALFAKLRWKFVEISYRGLLGNSSYYYPDTYRDGNINNGFGYNNHQLMLGVHFETSKRVRK